MNLPFHGPITSSPPGLGLQGIHEFGEDKSISPRDDVLRGSSKRRTSTSPICFCDVEMDDVPIIECVDPNCDVRKVRSDSSDNHRPDRSLTTVPSRMRAQER